MSVHSKHAYLQPSARQGMRRDRLPACLGINERGASERCCRSSADVQTGTTKTPRLHGNNSTRWSRADFSTCSPSGRESFCFFGRILHILEWQQCRGHCADSAASCHRLVATLRYSLNPNFSTRDSRLNLRCFRLVQLVSA